MMVSSMKSLEEINDFVQIQKAKVKNTYRLKYHMMPPVGWMNDPNGLIYFKGKYHFFYQYNPFRALPGTMLWGHSTTTDFLHFKDEPVALAPTIENTSIFSGGAIEVDGILNAIYTLHYECEDVKKEEVYLSKSMDGIHFEEAICVFNNETLPENISRSDFRDPFPTYINNKFYVFVGGKDLQLNQGVIVVLEGESLEKLKYSFTIGPFYELGDMGECPSYFRIQDKDVLLVSGCHVQNKDNDFKNINSSCFIVGNIDFNCGYMDVDFIKEIDKGDAFYAPQFINGIHEPIMIGWMEMWGKEYPTNELNHHWTGAFTIPRKLSLQNHDIYQEPISLKEFHKNLNFNYPHCLDMSFELKNEAMIQILGRNGKITLALNDYFILDTTQANNHNGFIRRTNSTYKTCFIQVVLDVSSIEIFINHGKEAISSRIYLDGDYDISFNENVHLNAIKEVNIES